MSKRAFFVTGTDTEVGKTLVAQALLNAAGARGWSTLGLKPVSAGCEKIDGQWQNDDARRLRAHSSLEIKYSDTNPVAVEPAIAPHIALADERREVAVEKLGRHCHDVLEREQPDFAVVEGAGGWLVPLNETEDLAGLAANIGLPVILVVGLRLGCLNHALLTAQSVAASGLSLAGWVGTTPGMPMERLDDNLATLHARLSAPCIGVIPPLGPSPEIAAAATALNLDLLNA
jgi:dethiobiotin synthetase